MSKVKQFKEKTDDLIESLEDQVKKLEKYVDSDEMLEEPSEIENK